MGLYPPVVALPLCPSPSQSVVSQYGWGFHVVRGGVDPGDHRHRSCVFLALEIRGIYEPGMGPYLPRVRRNCPPLMGSYPPRAALWNSNQSAKGVFGTVPVFSVPVWMSYQFTEVSGTGIDVPNSPKCPVPILMLYQITETSGAGMKVCIGTLGTGIDVVPTLPKCPVPVLTSYRSYRSVRYRYWGRTKVTEVSGTGNTGGIYRRYASVRTVFAAAVVYFRMYMLRSHKRRALGALLFLVSRSEPASTES